MILTINNFTIVTKSILISTGEEMIVPQSIKNGKPTDFHLKDKKRMIKIFEDISYNSYMVIDNLFDFIEFIELLKAFSSNKLNTERTYKFKYYEAKIVNKNKIFNLCLYLQKDKIFLDKFETSSLAAKFSKILQKIEII
jgi:hypothetical protein